jgi:hypothetical protein
MGKGHFYGGSTSGTFDEDGTPIFDEGHEFPREKGPSQKRWSENPVLDPDARIAAKKYRNLVSIFLARCAEAFRNDCLTASLPKPPSDLKTEISSWGGNIRWIDQHAKRKSQFAKFVLDQGWTPDPSSEPSD